MNKIIHEELETATENAIKKLLEDSEGEIDMNNLEILGELMDIHKDIANEKYWCMKEESEMYGDYGNYSGRGPNRGSYGNYGRGGYGDHYEGSYSEYGRGGNYGRRGRDMRYRGDDSLDRMYGEYGRYQESRSSYGAGEETDKSFHYMVKALEDFIKVLHEEADTEQQRQMLRETLQRSMM